MGTKLTPVLTVLGASAFVTAAAVAQSDNTDARIQALEAKIASLEQQLNPDQWMTDARAKEIRSLVADVLADADTRSSLLQGGGTAGWDKNFFLASADGNYRLNIKGQIQARYVFNYQDQDAAEDTTRQGFEMRRVKLEFSGHAFDPTIQYKVKGAFERDGGAFELDEAYIKKVYDGGWSIRFGQFKPPFLREELVSSSKQLAVDRSLVNEERNQDKSQGIEVAYKSDQFRFAAMYHDGFGGTNVPALAYDVEFAASGRAEFLFSGSWKQFDDFTSWQGEETAFMVGGGLHYQKAEFGTAAGPEEEEFMWTIDGSAEFGGANLYGALVGRHLDVADADRYGFVVQGGFFLNEDWELFGRYEWYDYDMSSVEDLSVITVGANRYFHKHALKWTTDIGFGINDVDPVFASSGVGYRGDAAGEDGQIVIRSQLQLLF